MESHQNEQVPEYAIDALEAAIAGLECGADEDESDEAFTAVWSALARLGRRDFAIGADGEPIRVAVLA